MVVISKPMFDEVCRGQACRDIFHPWSETCLGVLPRAFMDSVKGSLRFYTIVYLAQLPMHMKHFKSKEMWIKMAEYYCRSVTLGLLVPFTFITSNCLFSQFGIKLSYISSLLVPLTLNGLNIYWEPPSRRSLVINLFFNQLLEYWMRLASQAGYLNITKSRQTLMFMIGSGLLFYMMRLEGDKPKEQRTPLLWIYNAEKVNRNPENPKKPCPHKGPCQKHILKGYGTYFAVGLAISLAKLILPRIKTPLRALSSLRGRHFKMALFFGSYIGIYRAVLCFLCRKKGYDSELFALPAGYLAGLSMVFSPSLGVAIASLTGAMKLYSTILYEKKVIPDNIPLPEMLYCTCQGLLFTSRFVNTKACPPYIMNLTDTISHGHCEAIHQRVAELISKRNM
ncbi:transmembrane protein 135-like [Ostrinia furnacalis]|uniref:transmembrane protein 135-like n=1 Tax=Ostrinia furnacalis TaxID=93504 RepID=UPI00103BB450|nr:transmembrane protein 135-like [Ostrinia furnacalis]XP_028164650.1 transmembrane protein 135-like [Ostrinia furnacalis]